MADAASSPDPKSEIVTSIWFGLAAIRRHPGGRRRLRLRWVRLLGTVMGLGAVGWLMAALGIYFFLKLERGYQDERFSDVLFLWVPANLERHNRAMGEYFIRLADDHIAHYRYDQAMTAYRLGVMKVPENLHAREMLSQFYYLYYKQSMEQSLGIMEDGLPYALDNDANKDPATLKDHYRYLNEYLSKLQQAHLPGKLEEVCQKYLAQNPDSKPLRELLALNLVSAYIDDGVFDKAADTLKTYQLEQTLDGVMLASRLLWDSGRMYEAPKYLEKALPRFDVKPANLYLFGLLSRYYRDLGNLDKAEYYIQRRVMEDYTNAMPQIELLYINAKSGDKAGVALKVQNLKDQFHDNASAMNLLATFATDQGDVAMAKDLLALAETEYQRDVKTKGRSDFYLPSFALLVVEAYLTTQRTITAGRSNTLIPWMRTSRSGLRSTRLLFDSMRAIADYGLRDLVDADYNLTKLIKSDKARPDTLMTIANRFLSHGALDQAQRLLEAAHQMDPHNQAILDPTHHRQLGTPGNSADMSQNLRDLLKTAPPAPLDLLYDAYTELGSDRFIFVPDREDLLNQIFQHIQDAINRRTPRTAAIF